MSRQDIQDAYFPEASRKAEQYIFLIILLCSIFFTEVGFQTSNYSSRFFLTKAIIDYQTFKIDFHCPRLGTDWAWYRGHYFSDKPPGASLMMIPQYLILGKPLEFLLARIEPEEIWREMTVAWIVQISSLSIYSALSFVGLFRIFGLLGLENRRFSLTLLSYFGTLMFTYSSVGMGEMFTVPLVVGGTYFLLKKRQTKKDILYSGLFFGLGFLTTTQVFIFIFTASIFVLWQYRADPRHFLWFAIPTALSCGLMLLYNRINFDGFLNFPVGYWRGRGGAQNIWLAFPPITKIIDILFLPARGIFFHSPFLILGLLGYKKLLKRQPARVAFFLITSFLFYLLFFFVLFLTEDEGPAGGNVFGFRYIVPALPFLCISAAVWLSDRNLSHIEMILVIVSICICTAGAIIGYRIMLTDYSLDFLFSFPARNFISHYLYKRFGIQGFFPRFVTTGAFCCCIGAILLKYRGLVLKEREGDQAGCQASKS